MASCVPNDVRIGVADYEDFLTASVQLNDICQATGGQARSTGGKTASFCMILSLRIRLYQVL